MRYYPVFLDLRGRLAVVVGDGEVALDKVRGLLDAGARVRLIGAAPIPALAALADRSGLEHRARPYRGGDLAGAFIAFAERSDAAANRAVFADAEALGVPVNVQDDTACCTFVAAALVRRGDLIVAIGTSGQAPALAVRLRQRLERELGPQHARFLELAGAVRAPLLAARPDFEDRRERWYRLVDSDVLERLATGDEAGARRRFAEILGVVPPPDGFAAEAAVGASP